MSAGMLGSHLPSHVAPRGAGPGRRSGARPSGRPAGSDQGALALRISGRGARRTAAWPPRRATGHPALRTACPALRTTAWPPRHTTGHPTLRTTCPALRTTAWPPRHTTGHPALRTACPALQTTAWPPRRTTGHPAHQTTGRRAAVHGGHPLARVPATSSEPLFRRFQPRAAPATTLTPRGHPAKHRLATDVAAGTLAALRRPELTLPVPGARLTTLGLG